MEQGRVWVRCAAWGGASLGVGTLAFALCSPSSVGCSTNVVVLTHSAVTARGCATYSMIARFGIGVMVLGAVLLLGSFRLAVRTRRQASAATEGLGTRADPLPAAVTADVRPSSHVEAVHEAIARVALPVEEVPRRRPSQRAGPIPPGEGGPEWDEPTVRPTPEDPPLPLPPGWYGNPNNPDKPVQWWDGTKLQDQPPRRGR